MKKYIQPSLKVRELELASMIAASNPDGFDGTANDPNNDKSGGLSNSHRGWNLWGVED